MILGIDEVGRGPWAGPLVVGAVVLGDKPIDGLTDSKKLSAKRRQALADLINAEALAVGLGWVWPEEIDDIGLGAALKLATVRAVEQIKVPYHEIIIDGTVNFLADTGKGRFVTTLKKADLLISSVSAASIIAKVARDGYMKQAGESHPGYGFDKHVGYGTLQHRQAIKSLGVTPLHRLSFAPLRQYKPSVKAEAERLTTKQLGNAGEDVAAAYLESAGHEILERNFKTKQCEIDIISKLADKLYFTEVKYRRQDKWGDGLAAITPSKLKQMTFAARVYAAKRRGDSVDLQLAAVAVAGQPPRVIDFVEI